MIQASPKFQICVGFIVACASFRFRQMTQAKYLMDGSYFQHAEFLLNAFIGVCWIRADLIALAIHLIITMMFVNIASIYLSCKSLEDLAYYGTFRTKYFFDAVQQWPFDRIVQAETCLDILLGMILIRALEEIEREHLEVEAEQAAQRENEQDEDNYDD